MEKSEVELDNKLSKKYIVYTILAGILTLIPVGTMILGIIDTKINSDGYINESIYAIVFYAVKVIGFLIYIFVLNQNTKKRKALIIISGIFLILTGLAQKNMESMDNKGLDYIGEALARALIFKACLYIYYISTIVLFISYSKKFLFKKKVIIAIVVLIIFSSISGVIIKQINNYTSTQKINDDIPTVNDFKSELMKRNLYDNDGLLLGIDNKDRNIHRITNNLDEKYPSYIYLGYKTKNLNKYFNKNEDYLYWIIYYTNGKLYAALVDDYKSSYPESFYIYSNILSEEETKYVYNTEENYYDIIKSETDYVKTDRLYYEGNNRYISIEYLKKCDYGYSILCVEYKLIDKINSQTLDNYAEQLKTKESN